MKKLIIAAVITSAVSVAPFADAASQAKQETPKENDDEKTIKKRWITRSALWFFLFQQNP